MIYDTVLEFLNTHPEWVWFLRYWIFSGTLTAFWMVEDAADEDIHPIVNIVFGLILGPVFFPILGAYRFSQMKR